MDERLVPKVAPFVIPALIFLISDTALIEIANFYFHPLKTIFINKITAYIETNNKSRLLCGVRETQATHERSHSGMKISEQYSLFS